MLASPSADPPTAPMDSDPPTDSMDSDPPTAPMDSDPPTDQIESDQLNYLTLLRPRILKNLFKFFSTECVDKVEDIHNENAQAFKDFDQYIPDKNVGECALFEAYSARSKTDGCLEAGLKDHQWGELLYFQEEIQHLAFASSCVRLVQYAYVNLKEYLLGELDDSEDSGDSERSEHNMLSLRSLHVTLKEHPDAKPKDFYYSVNDNSSSQRPSWFLLMVKLKEKKDITVTLKAIIRPEKLARLSRTCDILSLPAEDPFCQYVVDLRFHRSFPNEKAMHEYKPELTAHAFAFFLAKLPVLQRLEISALNLSTAMLEMFIRRSQNKAAPPLKSLYIYTTITFKHVESDDLLPAITDDTWQGLVKAYPTLQLDLHLTLGYLPKDTTPGKYIIRKAATVLTDFNTAGRPNKRRLEPSENTQAFAHGKDKERSGARPSYKIQGLVGVVMNKILKSSAPLVALVLRRFTALEFNGLVNKCRPYRRTLQLVSVEDPIGDPGTFHFGELTSGRFTMRNINIYQTMLSSKYSKTPVTKYDIL